jgi:NAD(P)-dependent dehydrogenase (short-subunit alcohol dehydrogenase family)
MAGRLEGKTALVTGAGRGIGRGVALALGAEGANVVVNDPGVNLDGSGTDNGPAEQVAAEIKAKGGTAAANFDSVASLEGGENMIKQCLDEFGRVDIVVNVAGILRDRMIFNMTEQEWDEVIAVHLYGHYHTIKPASILMRQQRWGRIVNFSSISGLEGAFGQWNYGAAKAGIAGLTRVVARDLGRYGVTCNAIAPGAATRMTATITDTTRALRDRAQSGGGAGSAEADVTPIREPELEQLRDPEYVAPMVVWLCTDAAWDVNGKIFHVAGGSVALAHEESPVATINKDGQWTIDELATFVPSALMKGIVNPAPPANDLTIPGRAASAPTT